MIGKMIQDLGKNGAKFSYKKMNNLIKKLSKCDLDENKKIIKRVFNNWKAERKQFDDYLIVGYNFKN